MSNSYSPDLTPYEVTVRDTHHTYLLQEILVNQFMAQGLSEPASRAKAHDLVVRKTFEAAKAETRQVFGS